MKSVKFFILPLILFIFSVFLMIKGFINTNQPTVPFTGTVEKAEGTNLSGYNYFKLTDGYALSFLASYEVETPGNKVKSVIYPLVSGAYLNRLSDAYDAARTESGNDYEFEDWFKTYKDKPKFYVEHMVEDSISSEFTFKAAMLADTLPKSIEGTRFNSSFSLGYISTADELDAQGITVKNTIFIDEGMTPEEDKAVGKVLFGFGAIVAVIALVVFFAARRKAKRQKYLESIAGTLNHNA